MADQMRQVLQHSEHVMANFRTCIERERLHMEIATIYETIIESLLNDRKLILDDRNAGRAIIKNKGLVSDLNENQSKRAGLLEEIAKLKSKISTQQYTKETD